MVGTRFAIDKHANVKIWLNSSVALLYGFRSLPVFIIHVYKDEVPCQVVL